MVPSDSWRRHEGDVDEMSQALPEFFISRAGAHPADVAIAAKVGQIIEAEGYRVILQQWDFANRNFMERMDAALASGARVVAILTPQYLATDYCAAEWMHALDGDPLNRKGRLIVLRAAECEPKGLSRTIAYWDLAPIRDRDDLLTDIVKAAIMPDAERRHVGAAGAHWREARALLHDAINPTPSFIGREEHLQRIRDALWSSESKAAAITQPAAVTGLGGVGKSTLAREYAWQAQDRYAGVWWLNAAGDPGGESWGEVEQGLVALGDQFVRGLAQAEDRGGAARYALDFLARGGFSKPWLLIFDNVDNPRVLDVWRPRGDVHVLVTSRIGNWSLGVSPIEVDVWELPEAIAYLIRETGRADLSETQLAELAASLGRLPLALSHAAAYLRRRKTVTIKDYLDDLDRHMSECPKDVEYRSPVYATFRAALLQAEQEISGATALMSLAAFFAPDDIPEELFQQNAALYGQDLEPVVSKPARLSELLGVLDDLSLIDFEPETRTFSTHRVVQAAARDALGPDRDAWAQRAVGIAFSAFPEPAQQTWSQCARLVAHVRALNALVPAEAATQELGGLLGAAGEYSRERAALAEVLPFFKASLAIFERLAKADPGNAGWQRGLSVLHGNIGDVQRAQGDLAAALTSYQASHAISERLAKADPGNAGWQRGLSVSHERIGDVQQAQGALAAALTSYRATLAIGERLAKADPGNAGWQRDLSVLHGKIGDVQQAQGNLAAALTSYQVSHAITEHLAKADSGNADWQRDLSVSHGNIGDVQRAQGDLAAALTSYQASHAIRERLAKADPGNAHWQRDLSVSHGNIGGVQRAQGALAAALTSYQASLAIGERLAKADPGNAGWQRDLSVSHAHIGDVQQAQGALAAALTSYQTSRAIFERLAKADPGNAHWQRDLALSYGRVALAEMRQGVGDDGLKSFRRGREIIAQLIRRSPDNTSLRRDLAWFDSQIDTHDKIGLLRT